MPRMTKEQIQALIQQLTGVVGIFAPGSVPAVTGLVAAFSTLKGILDQIKQDDPATWAAVSKDFNDALTGFQASVERNTPPTLG